MAKRLKIALADGSNYQITTVNAATYDLLVTDYDLSVTRTSTGACVKTIPVAQNVTGRTLYIADDGGNSSVNNITVCDDAGTPNLLFTINGNGDTYMIRYNGTNWKLR